MSHPAGPTRGEPAAGTLRACSPCCKLVRDCQLPLYTPPARRAVSIRQGMISLQPQTVARALLVVMVGAFIFTILQPGDAAPAVGEVTPDFKLSDLQGQAVRLSAYRGKVVVLNFWATWCPPCVEEMPSLNSFARIFASQGVVVVAVSVDDDERALRRFVADHQLEMVILRDPGRQVATLYQTYMYPETYILDRQGRLVQVLDRQGRLVRKLVGPTDWDDPNLLAFFRELTTRT